MITTKDVNMAINEIVSAQKRHDAATKKMKDSIKVLNAATERLNCYTRLRNDNRN